MFLGDTLLVPDEDILMILPWAELDKESRRAIQPAGAGRRVRRAAPGAGKTYVITERDGRFALYASAISSLRLVRRNAAPLPAAKSKTRPRSRKK